jgi:hypothetical protein
MLFTKNAKRIASPNEGGRSRGMKFLAAPPEGRGPQFLRAILIPRFLIVVESILVGLAKAEG